MDKKCVWVTIIILAIPVLSGCGKPDTSQQQSTTDVETAIPEEPTKVETPLLKVCQDEKVNLPGYGDPGRRLKNCFVEYPGEPSRRDKSYHIVEDICGQFSKEFMENMHGGTLVRIKPPEIESLNSCSYYFDEKEYIILNLEYLSIENQKEGNEAMDRKMEKNPLIPMDHYVAIQEDGALNAIYLVLNPNKFLSIRPSSKKTIGDDAFISLAANIAREIKNYQ